ncbi:MAG: 6-phosphogluconolactonase [Steroidobacteraceae bacterium]
MNDSDGLTLTWDELHYGDPDALADACAVGIGEAVDEAIALRREAVLALAGGSTSMPILRKVAAQRRDWRAVTILPTDERWVPAGHADSNLRALRSVLAAADGIRWCALVPDEPAGTPDATYARTALAAVPGPLDLCVLGMGGDGHFASLFPGAPGLCAALDPAGSVAAVAIVPHPLPAAGPHPRISLTLARLLNCRRLMLVIRGAEKLVALRRAGRHDGQDMPIAALLGASHPAAAIHWSP